jgi:hypothetical protein
MTDKELEDFIHHGETGFVGFAMMFGDGWAQQAIAIAKELRARLAQPEPEPVAWGVPNTRPTEKAQFMMLLHSADGCQYPDQLVPLYTAPPQREWQGLTDEEYEAMAEHYVTNCYFDTLEYARAIEAKLKEKNA